jgi:cysteine desulfurase
MANAADTYLDNAATTRVLPEVLAVMSRVLTEGYGNPSSRHRMGLAAEEHLRAARQTLAERVGGRPEDVVFTSGGTEADSLALLGTARRQGKRARHLLVSAVEHPAVLKTAAMLEREGVQVERIPVTDGGWVDPEQVRAMVREETFLVAVMRVNNETGIRQPTVEVARMVKERNPDCLVLVDAVQALPALPVTLDGVGADLLALSAHKVHGPKGTGCLVLRQGAKVAPLWGGGEQEGGLRPGTENVAGIAGFARAVELLHPDGEQLARQRDAILEAVRRGRPDAFPVGDDGRRAPHILCVAVPGVATEVLVNLLGARGVYASSGAACHSRRSLRSHVLDAMRLPADHGVLRFSLSGTTTDAEIERAAGIIGDSFGEI